MPSGGRNAYNTSLTGRWKKIVSEASRPQTSSRWLFTLLVFFSRELKTAHWWQRDSQGSSVLVRAEMLHIKARHHSFHPGRKIHPAHLAVHHFSPASFTESPQAAPRLLTLMLLMSASVPRGTAPRFYCGGPAGAPLTVGALVPISAPSLCPLTPRGQLSELDGKPESVPSGIRARWWGGGPYGAPQDSTSEEFPLRDVPPPSSPFLCRPYPVLKRAAAARETSLVSLHNIWPH